MNNHPVYKEIGEKVRKQRKLKNWTQGMLADAVNLKRTSVSNIESGNQKVPFHILVNMAEVMGILVEELLPNGINISTNKITPKLPDIESHVEELATGLSYTIKSFRKNFYGVVFAVILIDSEGQESRIKYRKFLNDFGLIGVY